MKFFFSLISVFGVLFFWQVLYDGFVGLGPSWFVVGVGIFCDQGVLLDLAWSLSLYKLVET